jgi:hypothetical protein
MKEEVLKLVTLFGLYVDYDQWDEKGWLRIKSEDFPDEFGNKHNCLILYKEDGYPTIVEELRNSLIQMGCNIKAKAIRKELNIK